MRQFLSSIAAGVIATTVASTTAHADDDRSHDVALTFSPLHLVLPVVELQGEFNLGNAMSASAILGIGQASDANDIVNATVIEIGGQFTYYLVGGFDHGMQLGAEVLFVYLTDADAVPGGVFGGGLSLGPYIGYKVAADFGLTFMAQLGVAVMAVAAASDDESASDSAITPLLNINVGWSF
jgi:hypothetical protein